MKFSEIRSLLSSATYVYGALTPEQVNAIAVDHYTTEVAGVTLFGTMEPIVGVEELEVSIPAPVVPDVPVKTSSKMAPAA